MKIFERVISSARWVHALSLASKHRYQEALDVLEKIYSQYSKYPEYFLLRGVLKVVLEDYSSSVADLTLAKKLVANSVIYNADEKRYLTYFSNSLLPPSKRNSEASEEYRVAQASDLDMSKVSKHLKKKFPLKFNE